MPSRGEAPTRIPLTSASLASEAASVNVACAHPARRLYAWNAYDGTLCVCCSECGSVLRGEAEVYGR